MPSRSASRTGSSCSGAGTGTPASSASWPPASWKRRDARSSWCRWMSTARARAAAAACRASTCTSASPPAPTSCSASAATPWRRASRCGRKTCPPSVGGSTTGRHGSAPCCAHRRWNATCPSTSTALRWRASAASTSWPPTVPTTPARSSCWKRLSWKGVYAVSEGKHSRLRLRQGNASLYAVWFGMHPEQVPYAAGDVVDAAVSLSVYDSARGAAAVGPHSWSCTRRASATLRRSRQLWCRRCAGARP